MPDHVTVHAREPVPTEAPVSCGIPGHDHPGTELRCDAFSVDEPPLRWEVLGRCGFATDFHDAEPCGDEARPRGGAASTTRWRRPVLPDR